MVFICSFLNAFVSGIFLCSTSINEYLKLLYDIYDIIDNNNWNDGKQKKSDGILYKLHYGDIVKIVFYIVEKSANRKYHDS